MPIPLYIAGLGPKAARLAGQEGTGFVTNELNREIIKSKLFPAMEKGAKDSGRNFNSLEKILFIPASYNEDKEKAIQSIRFWRGSMIKAFFDVDVHDPRIEENGQIIGDDTLEKTLLVVSNAEEARTKLKKYLDLGFTEIVLTNSSPDRNELLRFATEELIPILDN